MNTNIRDYLFVMIFCFGLIYGLFHFTKFVDRYADQHYQAKVKK